MARTRESAGIAERPEGRGLWIIGMQRRAGPEDPTLIDQPVGTDEGPGRGGEELWNAESIQPPTQDSEPPTLTLFISLEGVASRGFHAQFQAVSA